MHEQLDGWIVGGSVGLCCPMDKALLNSIQTWPESLISTAD